MISNEELNLRMKALLSLKDPAIVQIDDSKAVKKLDSEWELKIDVTFPIAFWEAMGKGRHFGWKDIGVPDHIKGIIEVLEEKYNTALEKLRSEKVPEVVEEPEEKEPEPAEEEQQTSTVEEPKEETIETPGAPEVVPEVTQSTEPQDKEKQLIQALEKLLTGPTKDDCIFSTGGAKVASAV